MGAISCLSKLGCNKHAPYRLRGCMCLNHALNTKAGMICSWVPKEREAKELKRREPDARSCHPRDSGRSWGHRAAPRETAGNTDMYLIRETLLLLAVHRLYIRIWLVYKIPFFVFLELCSGALHKAQIWVWFCSSSPSGNPDWARVFSWTLTTKWWSLRSEDLNLFVPVRN